MAVEAFIPLTVLQYNNTTDISRVQGVTQQDIRFAMVESTGVTLLLVEDRQKTDLNYLKVSETPAQILAAVEATGALENTLKVVPVTKLKHGGTASYSPAKDMLLNTQFFKDVINLSSGGSRVAYNVEEHKTPWIIETEDSLLPSDTSTATSTSV